MGEYRLLTGNLVKVFDFMEEKIGFGAYVVIPTALLMDDKVSSQAKLTFGIISNLSNQRGYCFASNSYIANLSNLHENTVSKHINELITYGYLIRFDEVTSFGLQRRLSLSDPIKEEVGQRKDLGGSTKTVRGSHIKQGGGVNENADHNNIRLIIKDEYSKINIQELIFEDDESNEAWKEWLQYRKEKKKSVTGRTKDMQIRLLQSLTPQERIASINQSITQGWTGLFEVKNPKKQQKNDFSGDYQAAIAKLAANSK